MKKFDICSTCIDTQCKYKNSAETKLNCPADDSPPIYQKAKSHSFIEVRIRRKLKDKLLKLHPACVICDVFIVNCMGRTKEEKIHENTFDDFCGKIQEWDITHN